jgi:hypothetical protein
MKNNSVYFLSFFLLLCGWAMPSLAQDGAFVNLEQRRILDAVKSNVSESFQNGYDFQAVNVHYKQIDDETTLVTRATIVDRNGEFICDAEFTPSQNHEGVAEADCDGTYFIHAKLSTKNIDKFVFYLWERGSQELLAHSTTSWWLSHEEANEQTASDKNVSNSTLHPRILEPWNKH